MNRSEQIDKALKDILKDVDCAKANKQCDIDYFLSSIEKCANAALAIPRRQFDVGTPDDQRKRFRLFCESHKPAEPEFTETGELLCPDSGCELGVCNYGQCALRWAQAPYEAQE